MQFSPEFASVINTGLIMIMMAVAGMIANWAKSKASYFEAKAEEWEHLAKETRERAEEAKTLSEGNRVILERNTALTEKIEHNSNGINDKLTTMVTAAAFKAGRLKGKLEGEGAISTEDLDKFEDEFRSVIDPGNISRQDPSR